jgi:hypothetical protein
MSTKLAPIRSPTAITKEELAPFMKALQGVRQEFLSNTYIHETLKVLPAGGYRSAIGSYWNAVVDDLRRKILHRSIDLFNKEMKKAPPVKTYEDFQDHVTDHELIEGAYKIGVLDWEARKVMHHARETRHIFDGHPHSSEPSLIKVLDLINDCNKYVLSEEYPPAIIEISDYIKVMETPNYHQNAIAIAQAFTDLPAIYKSELANRFYTIYTHSSSPTTLRANVEVAAPLLWEVLSNDEKKQVAARFDKDVLSGDGFKVENGTQFLGRVDGLKYVSTASRKIIIEPLIKELEAQVDVWAKEEAAVRELQRFASNVPADLLPRYVAALTRAYVGYKGSSAQFSRTTFYADAAAPIIAKLFEVFDDNSARAFVEAIREHDLLRQRIKGAGQRQRLRNLGNIILIRPGLPEDVKSVLELLADEAKTDEFFGAIKLK